MFDSINIRLLSLFRFINRTQKDKLIEMQAEGNNSFDRDSINKNSSNISSNDGINNSKFNVLDKYRTIEIIENYVHARYSNNLLLIDDKTRDEHGNRFQITHPNGQCVSNEYFDGVVYINEDTFEIYAQENGVIKAGVYSLKSGIDWNTETPRQKYNKAYELLKVELTSRIQKVKNECFCKYPRIIDYIENRNSQESGFLFGILQREFLTNYREKIDDFTGEEIAIYDCKFCKSEFVGKYVVNQKENERYIGSLKLIKNHNNEFNGKEVLEYAPNFLKAYFDELFCNPSYIYREKLYKADMQTTLDYLFEEKATSDSEYN